MIVKMNSEVKPINSSEKSDEAYDKNFEKVILSTF